MKGVLVFILVATCLCLMAHAGDSDPPKAESKGSGKVETGDSNLADIKMSTDAAGKNVKSSSSMEASSSKDKGSTKGEAKTEVKNRRKKRSSLVRPGQL